MSSPAGSEPSEIAGRYSIIKKLGAGAFGTVYKAKDRVLGRMVAIKTIRLEGLAAAGANLDEMVDRFKREAQVSAQLRHPNIVTIYDIGETNGVSYLAMEFIDGVGLDRVIAGSGRLPLERAAALAAQVADALDFAHRHSVVHRDIKPANIMVENGDRVKVTDFGIAKVIDSGEHLTMTGSLLGTPSYMSPEQAKGAALDGRSDLFAVGCIFYEMLAGVKAFRGDSITGLIFKIITEEPKPIREVDPGVSEEVAALVSKALAKAPEARFQTGRELADALLALCGPGQTPTIRQADVATTVLPPPASLATGTFRADPTVRPAVATAVTPPAPVAQKAARAAPEPRRGTGGVLVAVGVVAVLGMLALAGVGWYFISHRSQGAATTVASATLPSTAPPVAATPPPTVTSPPVALQATAEPAPVTPAEAPPAVEQRQVPPPVPEAAPPRAVPVEKPPVQAPPAQQASTGRSIPALDDEPDEPVDGRAAGEHLADSFRNGRSTGFGASGGLRARARSPRDLALVERPAVATLRHLIDREEGFFRSSGRYATLQELAQAAPLLDVPFNARGFNRKGYRFELSVSGADGFEISATPLLAAGRRFVGDDTGFIRAQ